MPDQPWLVKYIGCHRKFEGLTFVLVTFCLDVSSIVGVLVTNGRIRQYTLPQKRNDWHWARAAGRFTVVGDALYDNDDNGR